MNASTRSRHRPRRRRTAASLFVSGALLGFLGWRTVALAFRVRPFVNLTGFHAGLTLPLEARVRNALRSASVSGEEYGGESWALVQCVLSHVPEHAVVVAALAPDAAGREVTFELAALAFPRLVLRPRADQAGELERLRSLAHGHGFFALAAGTEPAPEWRDGATEVARTERHVLWQLAEPGR